MRECLPLDQTFKHESLNRMESLLVIQSLAGCRALRTDNLGSAETSEKKKKNPKNFTSTPTKIDTPKNFCSLLYKLEWLAVQLFALKLIQGTADISEKNSQYEMQHNYLDSPLTYTCITPLISLELFLIYSTTNQDQYLLVWKLFFLCKYSFPIGTGDL